MKVKILKDVIANIDGRSVRLHVGDIFESKSPDVAHLINGGYAEQERAAVKILNKPETKKAIK